MSDFSTLTKEQTKTFAKEIIEQKFLSGKTIAAKIEEAPQPLRPTIQTKIDETLSIYAAELEKAIKDNKKQNPTMNQQKLAAEVEKDLEAALKKNTRFTALASEASTMGIKIDINKIGDATRDKLAKYDAIKASEKMLEKSADKPATPDAEKTDAGTKLQRYSKEDAVDVRAAVAKNVPFGFNQAAMDDLLDNTMVQNKRGRSDTKMDGALGEMFKGMEPMMQRFMEMMMSAFQSMSGNTNGADYGVMNSTSAAMSRVMNDIEGSGPGEGVFKEYKNARGFTDSDLIKISSINGDLRKAQQAGDKQSIEILTKSQKALDDENKQRFGLSSKDMWKSFENDKHGLMEKTVQAMAVEARENGLKDTSTDVNRLMASYYSKGAAERASVDYETQSTVSAMKRGIIPTGDPSKITDEQKAIIEAELGKNVFGSSNGVNRGQNAPSGDVPLKSQAPLPSQAHSSAQDVALSQSVVLPPVTQTAKTSTVQTPIVQTQMTQTQMTQAQDNSPFSNLGIAQGQFGSFSVGGVSGGINAPRGIPTLAKGGCYGVGGV